jgi:hypothetical protein
VLFHGRIGGQQRGQNGDTHTEAEDNQAQKADSRCGHKPEKITNHKVASDLLSFYAKVNVSDIGKTQPFD